MTTKGKDKSSKTKDFIAALIALMIFLPFVYAYYKDYKDKAENNNKHSCEQTTHDKSWMIEKDSITPSSCRLDYSEWYYEGYEKGYATGEEDTNDGEYRAGYDDSNPYKGNEAADYRCGYEHGYEDAFEEIIETSDEDGDADAIW